MAPSMAQVQGSPPWSDLLPELLGLVFLRLPTRADRAFFPAVCRNWCSAARQCQLPLPSPVPWLVIPGGSILSFPRGQTLQLPDGVRCHTSCGEWLVLSRDDDSCFLINPFTKATMPLPSLSSYRYYAEPVEVAEDIMVPDFNMQDTWIDNMDTREVSVFSLVVCSTRLVAAIFAVGGRGTIALCRPGSDAWSVSAHEECRFLSHMVFFQGKLYALDSSIDDEREDLIAIDIVDEHDRDQPRVSRIKRLIKGQYLPDKDKRFTYQVQYLLESLGSLLIVFRTLCSIREGSNIHYVGSSKLEVFEADLEQHKWVEVRTLGKDQALFLGEGFSRSVRVSPYDLSLDSIFFMDECSDTHSNKLIALYRVYDMKDKKIYSPLPMVSLDFQKGPPVAWIFSQGETDKSATAGKDLHKTVEPMEVDHLTLIYGSTCSQMPLLHTEQSD